MIHFNFEIALPIERFSGIFTKAGIIPKIPFKAWEIDCYKSPAIIGATFHITTKCDHSGIRFSLSLAGYTIEFSIHDTRHWDDRG
jgi:hypothetical protein